MTLSAFDRAMVKVGHSRCRHTGKRDGRGGYR